MNSIVECNDERWFKRRDDILERDGWHCRLCDATQDLVIYRRWEVAGLKPWEYEDSQLSTLCQRHAKYGVQLQNQMVERLSRFDVDSLASLVRKLERSAGVVFADVSLTATNEATEPHRIKRLKEVLRELQNRRYEAFLCLRSLHDHKGTLEAVWYPCPESYKRLLEKLWRNEGETEVQHTICENLGIFTDDELDSDGREAS